MGEPRYFPRIEVC